MRSSAGAMSGSPYVAAGAAYPTATARPKDTAWPQDTGTATVPGSLGLGIAGIVKHEEIEMTTIVLRRAATLRAAAGRLRDAGALLRVPAGALVRDRVVQVLALSLLALGLLDAAQLSMTLDFVAGALVGIAPFLLLAVAIAASASASGADRLIARAFSGSPGRTIVLAAAVGALSPFCSCGVIPLIAAMLRAGVPLAPVMAFWLASPIMDPEMFVLTAAGVGLGFAVAKTAAAVAMGLLGGLTVRVLQRAGGLRNPLAGAACTTCGGGFDPQAAVAVRWRFWEDPERRGRFARESLHTGAFLLKWLSVAFLAESLMMAWLPAESVASAVGGGSAFAIPLAAVVGVPAYLNGYAAIPLISGLLEMGMSSGAALAFVTAGAVSSIPAAIAVWALVRRSVFVLYLALGLGGAMLSGIVYQVSGLPV